MWFCLKDNIYPKQMPYCMFHHMSLWYLWHHHLFIDKLMLNLRWSRSSSRESLVRCKGSKVVVTKQPGAEVLPAMIKRLVKLCISAHFFLIHFLVIFFLFWPYVGHFIKDEILKIICKSDFVVAWFLLWFAFSLFCTLCPSFYFNLVNIYSLYV